MPGDAGQAVRQSSSYLRVHHTLDEHVLHVTNSRDPRPYRDRCRFKVQEVSVPLSIEYAPGGKSDAGALVSLFSGECLLVSVAHHNRMTPKGEGLGVRFRPYVISVDGSEGARLISS
jgi:hypothetical protein